MTALQTYKEAVIKRIIENDKSVTAEELKGKSLPELEALLFRFYKP